MSLQRLIVCACGHDIEQHDPAGCNIWSAAERCACRLSRDSVLERMLALERDEIRRQWLPERERRA